MQQENLIYTWSFSSDKQRWKLWYIWALAIVIWLVVWGFLSQQYVMSGLIILISWVYLFVENNSEENIQVWVSPLWIQVNNYFYEYSKIQSYYFIYNQNEAVVLRLHINKKWLNILNLNVNNQITLDLQNILRNFIKEDVNGELSFSEKLIRILKL